VVSARDLHEFLGATERFSVWFERQLQYGFKENQDYGGCKVFNTLANQELTDYVLTINTAKEISMVQRSEKGKEARLYFIECERRLTAPRELSRLEILTIALESEKKLIERDAKILELEGQKVLDAPKVEFYDVAVETETTFDFQEAASILKLRKGRNTLFKRLKEHKVLMFDTLLYAHYLALQYFEVKQVMWTCPKTLRPKLKPQTRFTQKGLDWLFKNREKFDL
jgi:anti-repressor protein